jgi:LCP family protein required for cell wall assembly
MGAHSQSTIERAGGGGPAPTERNGRRIAAILGAIIVLVVAIGGAVVFQLTQSVGNNVPRVPGVFGQLPASQRPADQTATTFLIVGTDSRSPEPTTGTDAPAGAKPESARSDVIMLASVAADRASAAVVSIPRDSWVDIPGRGMNKINAAYAFGGPTLLTQTVERLTGVRVNHFAIVDFAGFQALVDAVGGIDVQVAQTTSDRGVTFRQGVNHLNGAAALVYVRQRYGLPNGDLDRVHREQNALKAWLSRAVSSGALSNPIETYRLLDAMKESVSVDDTLSNSGLASLALSARGLQASAITYLSAPVANFGREGAQAVSYLDTARAEELWNAYRKGTIIEYSATHPSDRLAEVPA